MSYNKKLKETLERIKIIFEDIKKNTGWEPKRLPKDMKIEIGEAPEYYENFGIVRTKNKIVFGKWVDEVEPKAVSNHFWEFLIIRESFSFFFVEKLLFGKVSQMVNYFLNLVALSYLQTKDPQSSSDIKFVPIQGRFLLVPDNISQQDKEFYLKISSLVDIINQGSSYKMVYSTFLNFVEDIDLEDIFPDEIIDDVSRYLSNKGEEIAAPIYLKTNTTEVLETLIDFGFTSSSTKIAEKLGLNQSTIARQIVKISSKFYGKWRLEKNYFKLGLYSYLILIKTTIEQKEQLAGISDEFSEIKYFHQLFQGNNKEHSFLYSIIHCPHYTSQRIERKLKSYLKSGYIIEYVIKPIQDRIYRTAIVNKPFKPTVKNFQNLINNKINSRKIILWNYDHFADKENEKFEERDENLIRFMSIIISKSISKFGLFGAHYQQYMKFMEDNNLDPNNVSDTINFLNKLQNQCFDKGLVDYRFNISLSGTAKTDILVIRIFHDELDVDLDEILEEISCFGWTSNIKTLDDIFFLILGLEFNNPIVKDILAYINNKGFKTEYFSMKNKFFRYISYFDLYDFKSQKWFLQK